MKKVTLPKITKRQMAALRREQARELAEHKRTVQWIRKQMASFRKLTRLQQFDVTARLVGDFPGADGYAYLIYADGADHSTGGEPECKLSGHGNHSCHLHLGHMGITDYNEFTPKRWTHGRCFCAQAKTRDLAIKRALKLSGML